MSQYFSYYIKKDGKYIPFKSFTKKLSNGQESTFQLDQWHQDTFKVSRWRILHYCGKKFTANEGTDFEVEATPNDVVVFPHVISWRMVGLLCSFAFGSALLVWLWDFIFDIPDFDFVTSLKIGGGISTLFMVFAFFGWLFSFEDKSDAKRWNAELIPADKLVIPKVPKRLFFDAEFSGLHKGTTLISLGIVSDCGKSFYSEFVDYEKSQVNDWIQDNVIAKLQFTDKITASCSSWEEWKSDKGKYDNALAFSMANKDMSTFVCIGETTMIKDRLERWLAQFAEEGQKVEMWSDCLAYDWVLFLNIFGTAFDLPKHIYYIPFDLATALKVKGIDPDIKREEYAYGVTDGSPESKLISEANKHNALWDAIVIKDCCSKLL